MSYEIFYEKPNSDYGDGVLLEKYNDVFSLIVARRSQKAEGTIYKKWVFPQNKDRQPIDKAIPMKVELGNSQEAIKTLKYFLEQLTNYKEVDEAPVNSQEDIPF